MFHEFNPHDQIEIADVDHVDGTIWFRSLTTGEKDMLPFRGVDVASSSMVEGRVVHVQYGKVTALEADYSRTSRSRRGLRAGDRKISAMRHPRPTVTPLALSVMRWSLGESECSRQLALYGERANSNQRKTQYAHQEGRLLVDLDMSGGSIKAECDLGRARTSHQGVHLLQDVPALVLAAMAGRRIDEIVDHPALHAGGVIQAANPKDGGGAYLHLEPRAIGIAEAIQSMAMKVAA